jgi:hypothetical protein
MTGQELKSRVFDERERVLCQNCKFRYCPTYDCSLTDKAKALTDKQWDNIAKNVGNGDDLSDVPYEIWKRRVKHDQH